jgi:hypothetical protein
LFLEWKPRLQPVLGTWISGGVLPHPALSRWEREFVSALVGKWAHLDTVTNPPRNGDIGAGSEVERRLVVGFVAPPNRTVSSVRTR